MVSATSLAAAAPALATWVAEKAKKRNRKVPANSPIMAMKWFLMVVGSQEKP